MDNSKLGNYVLFLSFIQKKINEHFENQKDYIFCKEGCSKCCKKAQFPYTEIEFRLLMQGVLNLEQSLQQEIMAKVKKVLQAKKEHMEKTPDEKFRYDCPLLINDSCSVYGCRGIICRCFGLMTFEPGSKKNSEIPFCAYENLNYSNVLDTETDTISEKKYKQANIKEEPKAFNASYLSFVDDEFAKGFDFEFGEIKPLINWFEEFEKL